MVIETLLNRADGMFRWVSHQFEALRRCLAPCVRLVLEELLVTLGQTYERILQEIPKVNQVHAYRLLQCLAVAVRPLRVQELAEVLAIDFPRGSIFPFLGQGVPNIGLSCRVHGGSFARPLYSPRALTYYYGQTAKACIGVLLHLEQPINNEMMKKFPLADYAAKHFADHAGFGKAISHIADGINDLLNADKPHFALWMSYISSSWWAENNSGGPRESPLYHVADLGFYDLVQHLTTRHPQDMIARGGVHGTSMHAALRRRHVRVCQLLLPHCAGKDVRDASGQTPLHVAASNALPEVSRVIMELGADINARDNNGWTPLHQPIDTSQLLGKRKLDDFWRPPHVASCGGYSDIMQLLLEHGADPEAQNDDHITALHLATQLGKGRCGAAAARS